MITTIQLINLDYLDMMSEGDVDMKITMLEMLIDEIPEEIGKMDALLAAQDWKNLNEVSHKLKSTLSYVGADVMTNANSSIDQATKVSQGLDTIPANLKILKENQQTVISELQEVLKSL